MAKKILVADYSDSSARVLEDVLGPGFKVDYAGSIEDAPEKARKGGYDMILVGQNLKMSGRTFTEGRDESYRLLRKMRGKAAHVIFWALAPTPEAGAEARKAGATAMVPKVDTRKLKQMLASENIEGRPLYWHDDPDFTPPSKRYPAMLP